MPHLLSYTALLLLWICCSAQKGGNDCGPPPRRDREELAKLPGKPSYSHGEEVIYNCRPGYIKLGRLRFQCNDGEWVQSVPRVECRKKPCGHPGDIQSGSFDIVNENEFVFGARVVYRCDDGYKMLSHTNYRDCRADGWSNDVPHCEVTKCFPVKAPENGRILMTGVQDLDQEFLFGQVLRFECSGSFKIQGSEQIFCTAHGNWSDDVPRCVEITCQEENIDHGYILNPKKLYKEGDRVHFSCSNGYKHAERSDATCTRNGWSSRIACIEIVCSPPQVENGDFHPKQSHYDYQDTIETQCESGYQLQNRQSPSMCTETGWSPPPICIPKNCDYIRIENGQLSDAYERWKDHYFPRRVGQTVDYSCSYGFLPRNRETWGRSSCTKFGWDPEPKCFKKCGVPRLLAHGTFNAHIWQKFIEGDEISYSCEVGYDPINQQAKAVCTKNGWSPTPRCNVKKICQPAEPPNGFFTERKNRYNLNDKISYRCQPGFTTPQGLETGDIQCHEEGWKPEPKCIKTCQVPTQNNVIFNTSQSVFLFEEILHYKCKDGFETIKKATADHVVCTENGWSPNPECLPIHCDGFLLENGLLDPRKSQYQHGDVVKFSCHRKYKRVGPDSAQCYHFGWSPQPPTCKTRVNPCQPPPSISDGSISGDLREGYEHGEKVEYKCNFGFAMTGSKLNECLDGQWTSLPLCKEETRACEVPPNIRNGRPVSVDSDRYLHGETVAYECNERFYIVGTKEAVCLHGQWELPSCVDVAAKCTRPQNAEFVPFASLEKSFMHNNVATYICGSNQHKTKCVNGKWSPEPECTAFCPPPPQLPNAIDITDTRNYKSGEEISFRCQENFFLQGPQKIKCDNGKWQTPPRCLDTRCGDPPAIAHGEVNNSSQRKYLSGESVEYHCHEGFELGESSTSTCENREWSPPPTCREKSCGEPPILTDAAYEGLIKNRYEPGDLIPFKCAPGYATEGPRNITCHKGKWSEASACEDATCGEPPAVASAEIVAGTAEVYLPDHELHYQCHEGFEISGSPNVTCQNKEWSEPPTCVDVTCPPPPRVSNGQITTALKERYLPLEKVRYRCLQRYSLFGAFTVKCVNKEWTASPRCIDAAGKCGPPPPIENGDFLGRSTSEYMPGAYVRYKCQALYNMQGDEYVQCVNGHWTDTPTCIVPCTATEEDMNQNNIRLKWQYANKIYSASGDVTEFDCKRGFQKDPSSPPFRAQCREGKLDYPRCIP
ncbi:complement factor H-like isoform X1 [Podarcis raffonei]|uniref:complement factor H-like isoform X1 n=1 Tax=Podarcis raffonei TaxID=65483 RepID=UPI00232962E7|nr:complement factor H-like isoform X1 [Podarcis raffonei]